MNNYAQRLQSLGFAFTDFELRDDGAGMYMHSWFSSLPQPTLAQLEAITDQRLSDARKDRKAEKFSADPKIKALLTALAAQPGIDGAKLIQDVRDAFSEL